MNNPSCPSLRLLLESWRNQVSTRESILLCYFKSIFCQKIELIWSSCTLFRIRVETAQPTFFSKIWVVSAQSNFFSKIGGEPAQTNFFPKNRVEPYQLIFFSFSTPFFFLSQLHFFSTVRNHRPKICFWRFLATFGLSRHNSDLLTFGFSRDLNWPGDWLKVERLNPKKM